MKVLGMRFCRVASPDDAKGLAAMLRSLGLPETPLGPPSSSDSFNGAVFPTGDAASGSWIELWPAGPQMPSTTMLQIVVDDADAFAEHARTNGLEPKGPDIAHGERIYYLEGPGGLPVSFQSKASPEQDRDETSPGQGAI